MFVYYTQFYATSPYIQCVSHMDLYILINVIGSSIFVFFFFFTLYSFTSTSHGKFTLKEYSQINRIFIRAFAVLQEYVSLETIMLWNTHLDM